MALKHCPRVIRKFRSFLFVLVLVVVAVTGYCLYEAATMTQDTAKDHIQIVFAEECVRHGLNPKDFQGPFIKNGDFWHYEFYWNEVKTGQLALGLIQFFPLQSDIWFLGQESKL